MCMPACKQKMETIKSLAFATCYSKRIAQIINEIVFSFNKISKTSTFLAYDVLSHFLQPWQRLTIFVHNSVIR